MDSFPQLQRCFERQWAGLDSIDQQRAMDYNIVQPGYLPPREVSTRRWGIWILGEGKFPQDYLLSVKTETYTAGKDF